MNTKRLYLDEWLSFRGLNQSSLVRQTKLDKGQISKLVANQFKRAPQPETMRKISEALNIRVEDLWRNPFDTAPREQQLRPVVDLEDWLNDPYATVDGQPATPEFKTWLRSTLDQMIAGRKK